MAIFAPIVAFWLIIVVVVIMLVLRLVKAIERIADSVENKG
jgi:hypothetical protein